MHFMKAFQKIVVVFYKDEVLIEEPILKWYKDAHMVKRKSIFLEQMKKFMEWLRMRLSLKSKTGTEFETCVLSKASRGR